jgi:DNA (cytosine-5)-methyltransferase 1
MTQLSSKKDKTVDGQKGEFSIPYQVALNLILEAEAGSQFTEHQKAELPAIVSHWLQSSEDPPILLDASFGKKWRKILLEHCETVVGKSGATPIHVDFTGLSFPPTEKPKFSFIDLFAGIGGFRIALQQLGGKCVFSSEWDRHAKETYFQNYGEVPFGDIKQFTGTNGDSVSCVDSVVDHDILAGGFPCQAFSQAGKQLGFNDARGTLFFDVLKIIEAKRPKAVFLENVKRLQTHDKGRTFLVVVTALRSLGYEVYTKVLRAFDFGLPQNRERIFIVAFKEPIHFDFPVPPEKRLHENVGSILENNVPDRYTISDRLYEGHKRRLREHREKGNGFGFSLFKRESLYTNTLSARYWKDGSEILIDQGDRNPRLLTPRECSRLQGFPDAFQPHTSKRHGYQQLGNSVPVPMVFKVAEAILKSLQEQSPLDVLKLK